MANLSLPQTINEWSNLNITIPRNPWWEPWELLRPFFLSRGYHLYKRGKYTGSFLSPPEGCPQSPALDCFGLFGERENFDDHCYAPHALTYAARDSKQRDVVIKLVHNERTGEGSQEYNILRMLNSEPLRSDPRNSTVLVVDFLEFEDWRFVVMPYYSACDVMPFVTPYETLDFAEHIIRGISFLHSMHISHQDISPENIVLNHHGSISQKIRNGVTDSSIWDPEHIYRYTFPCRYLLLDFGRSVYFPSISQPPRIPSFQRGRIHMAPESSKGTFDPFAADVFQVATVVYGILRRSVSEFPGLLDLLQDMTRLNPRKRISMLEAASRMTALFSQYKGLSPHVLYRHTSIPSTAYYYDFRPVPFSGRRWQRFFDLLTLWRFRDILELFDMSFRYGGYRLVK
ncbi:kinase-like protein [Hymenopellis radicata]|nr:kinase-like protein [Hymenopellis radicata]